MPCTLSPPNRCHHVQRLLHGQDKLDEGWGGGCSQRCATLTSTGMAPHVSTTTIPPATTPANMTDGTVVPRTGCSTARTAMLTGHTASHVSTAIFHRAGGCWGARNHASSPCSGRETHSPSVSGRLCSSHALNSAEA